MDIILMRNPSVDGDPGDPADRSTGLQLSYDDWSGLFDNILHVVKGKPYSEGEPYFDYNERQRSFFAAQVREMGYPLLSRFFDIYEDVKYLPSEIAALLNECESIKCDQPQDAPVSAINKLIHSCNAALKNGLGVLLSSD